MRRFAERSRHDLTWLVDHGVDVPMGFDPSKAVVPERERHRAVLLGEREALRVVGAGGRPRPSGGGHRHDRSRPRRRAGGGRATGWGPAAARRPARRSRHRRRRLGHRGRGPRARPEIGSPVSLHAVLAQVITLTGTLFRRVPSPMTTMVDRFERRRGRDTSPPGPPRGGAGHRWLLLQPRDGRPSTRPTSPGPCPSAPPATTARASGWARTSAPASGSWTGAALSRFIAAAGRVRQGRPGGRRRRADLRREPVRRHAVAPHRRTTGVGPGSWSTPPCAPRSERRSARPPASAPDPCRSW